MFTLFLKSNKLVNQNTNKIIRNKLRIGYLFCIGHRFLGFLLIILI